MNEQDLLDAYKPLIIKTANSFAKTPVIDYDDLFQIGVIGFLSAARNHDSTKGKLTTHAVGCMTNELIRAYNEEKRISSFRYYRPQNEHKIEDLDVSSLNNLEFNIFTMVKDGYKYREIAETHNKSITWVCFKVKRIIKKLREANV